MLFLPCSHLACCEACTALVRGGKNTCPWCSREIEDVVMGVRMP